MVKPSSNCRYCKCPLTFSQTYTHRGVCDNFACRSKSLESEIRQSREAEQQSNRKRRQVALQEIDDLPVAVDSTDATDSIDRRTAYPVPAMLRELTVLPECRRLEFENHLQSCLEAAFSESNSEPPLDAHACSAKEMASPPLPILTIACGTCRGKCCKQGGSHAFISKELIVRMRQDRSGAKPQDLFNTYVSHLAEFSYDGSCVFHQERGCGLPRELRADLCNSFECEDLHCLKRESSSSDVLIVAIDGLTKVRSQWFSHVDQ